MNITVILGKRLNDDGSMKEELIKRIELGLKVFDESKSEYLVLCGGMPNKLAGKTEASQMNEYVVSKGFDSNKIIIEDKSKTTWGNAIYLKRLIKNNFDIEKVYLVSTAYHFERKFGSCLKIFKRHFNKSEIIKCESEE